MMSHAEFKMFAHQPLHKLYAVLRGMSGKDVLKLLRELQIGLASYSIAYTLDKNTQMLALGMLRRVEKTAFKEFARYKKMQIFRDRPDLRVAERAQTVKEMVNAEWGRVYAANSY